MKIVCVIDHLGPGGAQRQLTTLALFFKKMGHEVSFLTYHENDFFLLELDEAAIPVTRVSHGWKIRRALALRKIFKSFGQDVVLAFLEGPSLYAELATLPFHNWGLVVSERLEIKPWKFLTDWKKLFHHLADYVTTNSHKNRIVLERAFPKLAGRVVTIYNCVDLSFFRPRNPTRPRDLDEVRFVVVASYQERKNTLGLIGAIASVLQKRPSLKIRVDWYGDIPLLLHGRPNTRYLDKAQEAIRLLSLTNQIALHPAQKNIVEKYQSADAVILPSFREGLPNTICEGMACGCPILTSNIGDAKVFVNPGHNGFLFDPSSTKDMARAIIDFCDLSPERWTEMGRESRRIAEQFFSPKNTANAYIRLLKAATARRRITPKNWFF